MTTRPVHRATTNVGSVRENGASPQGAPTPMRALTTHLLSQERG
jgi:hypothetical protein